MVVTIFKKSEIDVSKRMLSQYACLLRTQGTVVEKQIEKTNFPYEMPQGARAWHHVKVLSHLCTSDAQ